MSSFILTFKKKFFKGGLYYDGARPCKACATTTCGKGHT